MPENKMKQVAKMLGVELGEEFRVEGFDDKFMLTSTGMFYYDIEDSKWQESLLIYDILKGTRKIVKPILNEKEKEYLSYIIKPFRDRVESIYKLRNSRASRDCIIIRIKDRNSIVLPDFKKGDMYKNMKPERKYSLEDLKI